MKTFQCSRTGKSYEVYDQEQSYCERLGVPLPDLCPEERLRTLMAFRNEWKLYRRKCDSTGESILSAYRPDVSFPVYKNDIWWGDTWDATSYGRDFDFSRTFFEQFADLQRVVPREGTSVFNSENCDYNSHIRNSRNCYLNSLVAKCEDTHYSYWVVGDKDVVDCMYTNNSTLCYECIDVETCYECVQIQEAKDCRNCYFSFQLQNCKNCIFSSNLSNAEYMAFNKPVSEDEFNQLKKKYLNGSYASYQEGMKKFLEIKESSVRRATHLINCENCVGDHLLNCKNCFNCFDGSKGEDCINAISIDDSKDLCNTYSAGWPSCEIIYYSLVTRGCTNIAFSFYSWFSSDLWYCDSTNSSQNCFGSIGLHHKKFCILNKQYTEEEYKTTVQQIIEHMKKTGEWGKFFPPGLSPFAYNESPAYDFYPLKKNEAVAMNFPWTDFEQPNPEVEKSIPAERLPDETPQIPDDVLNWALICSATKKPFRITAYELSFYRKMGLPLPKLHPQLRNTKRLEMRNPHQIFERSCDSCKKIISSTFEQQRQEKVYCEDCYLKHRY